MGQEILVNEQVEVGKKVIAEFEKYMPVKIAFWLKECDRPYWYLYLASDGITPVTLREAYGEVSHFRNRIRDPNYDPFRVNLVGTDDPFAKAALDVYRDFHSDIPRRIQNEVFGGTEVDGVYIYPPREAVAA
jgi:hypothetical protein